MGLILNNINQLQPAPWVVYRHIIVFVFKYHPKITQASVKNDKNSHNTGQQQTHTHTLVATLWGK